MSGLRHPEDIPSFSNDLQQYFGGDALYILLPDGDFSDDLGDHLLINRRFLYSLVIVLHVAGQHYQTDVDTAMHATHLLLQILVVSPRRYFEVFDGHVDAEVSTGGIEGLQKGVDVSASEVDDCAGNVVLALVDGLVEEIEESLLAVLHRVLAA
jgi:hypothetical protein